MIQKYRINNANKNFSLAILWINGGSNLDENGKKGINQILCSLISRGCGKYDNLSFSEYIDSHGADLNFEVFEDGILISLKALNEHFNNLFPLINLMIENPILSDRELLNVKRSTINNIKKEQENPFNIAFEKWRKIVYSNHPYSFNCNGYEKDINSIKHKDILEEYQNFKSRDKFLITNNLELNYKNLDTVNYTTKNELVDIDLSIDKKTRFINTIQKSNQTIIMLGNQTCSHLSRDYLPLKVLESHLSFGMSSLLFKLFREKNGITYDIGVYNPVRKLNAPFVIYLSVSNSNAVIAFKLLIKIWNQLLCEILTEEELNLAKVKLKSSFLISNQSIEEILKRKIQLIGFKLSPDFDNNCINDMDKIRSFHILEVAKKYLSKPFLSILGDEKICREIKEIWLGNS